MIKHVYIGSSKNSDDCCILLSLASFEQLRDNKIDIEHTDFVYGHNNGCKSGSLSYVLDSSIYKLSGRVIEFDEPKFFSERRFIGSESYMWYIEIDKIAEVVPV